MSAAGAATSKIVLRHIHLAGLLALLLAAPLGADDASPFGVNAHAPAGAELKVAFDRVEHAGIGWVRIDFVWALVETSQDQFDWSVYDAIVAAAESRGLSILGILAYTPAWATDGPPLSGPPRSVADWEDFCWRAAHRYRGRVLHWELWNEPNQASFWAGTRAQYIDWILTPGAGAVHAADSRARAGGPALAHLQSAKWYDWLLEALERAGGALDFATHHLYDSDGPADVTAKLEAETLFGGNPDFWDLVSPSVREVLDEAGWLGKPFWLDESGWASKKIGEAKQASHLAGLLEAWASGASGRDWLDKIFVYELRDGPPEIDPDGFGLLRADGSTKPAYDAYRDFVAAHTAPPPPLELLGARFAVTARWRNVATGETGYGHPLPFSDETGLFWFFDPANVELIVKALDGRAVNDRYWLFYGALSDVEYWVTVEDRTTGARREYHNPAGTYCGKADTSAFAAALGGQASLAVALPSVPAAAPAGACVGDADTLCLRGGRFAVEVEWHVPRDGSRGEGRKVNASDESGYFWFFDSGNFELVVKVLDGRGVNGRFWVFYGALSDVEYWVTVTDTQSGKTRRYHNDPGSYCGRADVNAF